MPIPHISFPVIDLECNDKVDPVDMMTGTDENSGTVYFDATEYIERKGNDKQSIDHFMYVCSYFFKKCVDYFGLTPDNSVRENKSHHILMNTNLVYLFLSYVEPNLLGHIFEKFDEILTEGVSYSEEYVANLARTHLSKEDILSLAGQIKDEDGEGAGTD